MSKEAGICTASFELVRNATCAPLGASLPSRPDEIEVGSGEAVLIIVESAREASAPWLVLHVTGGQQQGASYVAFCSCGWWQAVEDIEASYTAAEAHEQAGE